MRSRCLDCRNILLREKGGHIKGSTDWSDMQGGITYSWKWGNAGLVKDEISWGNNYNGANILGGNNPSFIQFRLHLNPVKWFNFDYFSRVAQFDGCRQRQVVLGYKQLWHRLPREISQEIHVGQHVYLHSP